MDISYLLFLQTAREAVGGIFDGFMLWWTSLGESAVTFALMAGVYWCLDKRIGQYMGMNVALACTANQFLKPLFHVERPWVRDERIRPVEAALPGAGGYSFPSGHTARAVATWGAMGSGTWKEKRTRGISLLCWIVTAGILFSRNYLGVHTPQDVAVSLLLGLIILWITGKAISLSERKPEFTLWISGAGCILCFLPMLRVGCLSNAGAGFGFFLGWLLEQKMIRFEIKGTVCSKLLKFGIGVSLLFIIMKVTSPVLGLFMESKYAGFFASFLLVFYIMAGYPFLWTSGEKYVAAQGGRKLVTIVSGICLAMAAGVIVLAAWKVRTDRNREMELQAQETNTAGQEVESAQMAEVVTQPDQSQKAVRESSAQTESPVISQGQLNAAQQEEGLQIIAHRGYSGQFPENTMAAFAGALDIGADYIELDVQMTRDGQIVVCHDDNLQRVAGVDGRIGDYTQEELSAFDVGSWFSPGFSQERIPLLSQVLELLQDSDMKVYLELKDIGETEGFEKTVVDIVKQSGMENRCVFASFRYEYLAHIKEIDGNLPVLYNTTSGKTTLVEEFPAEYYGVFVEAVTADTVRKIHESGRRIFVWTVNTPEQMDNVRRMGADGIVTNDPGLAGVIVHPEYEYLVHNFETSVTMPGLYEPDREDRLDDYVVQGLTKAGSLIAISAYSYSGERNSILYVINKDGALQKIVDLGFQAHTGGVAYDEDHDLLWITGASGHVYALSWSAILSDTYQGEILVDFDAGLVNHSGAHVASFLNLYGGELFVGSYVDGSEGVLKRYDISDPGNVKELSAAAIPQRIQGITFKEDGDGGRTMVLSQSYQIEDSHLLYFAWREEESAYLEPEETHVLPEGAEQIQMTAEGMYLLFESAARPYRATARIPNDQIYLVRG